MALNTVNNIFKKTMVLMDLLKDDGTVDTLKTNDYKNMFIDILEMEIQKISMEIDYKIIDKQIEDFDSNIELDDYLSSVVLPYAMASYFYGLDGNSEKQQIMEYKYQLSMKNYKTDYARVKDVFGIIDDLAYNYY